MILKNSLTTKKKLRVDICYSDIKLSKPLQIHTIHTLQTLSNNISSTCHFSTLINNIFNDSVREVLNIHFKSISLDRNLIYRLKRH